MSLALVLLALGCAADEPTQVDIFVDAGPSLRVLAESLTVESRGGVDVNLDEAEPTSSHVFDTEAADAWPVHVVIAPLGGVASREFVADIVARDGEGSPIARARVRGGFVDDRRVRVDLRLEDCCAGVDLCADQMLDGDDSAYVAEPACEPEVATDAPREAPVPLAPDNGASTGSVHVDDSTTPRFVWSPIVGATHYELAFSDDCSVDSYPDCAFGSPRIETATDSEHVLSEQLPISTAAPVGARWVWRVRACNGGGCGPWSGVRYLDVGRLPNDADGDGYSDLLVGAPGAEAAYLFVGTDSGPSLTPSAWSVVPGEDMSDQVGAAVAIGDLDGDGLAEMMVGAPGQGGRVYVFRGAREDLTLAHKLSAPPGDGVAGFGAAIAIADVDDDGRRDLVIGAPNGSEGAAYVVRWTADGPADPMRLTPRATPAPELGGSIANLGDVNDDGIDDVLVVAAGGEIPEAHLFLGTREGTPTEPALVLSSGAGRGSDGYAASAGRVGDLDGDGAAEIAVGADMMGEGGAVLLYWSTRYPERFGAPELLRDRINGDRYGTALVGITDLDGDGRGEILVGASGATSGGMAGAGRVYLVGSAELEPHGSVLELTASQAGAGFGSELASAGDVNGDGFEDVVVSAPGWDGGDGRVFLIPGAEGELAEPIAVPAPSPGAAFAPLPALP